MLNFLKRFRRKSTENTIRVIINNRHERWTVAKIEKSGLNIISTLRKGEKIWRQVEIFDKELHLVSVISGMKYDKNGNIGLEIEKPLLILTDAKEGTTFEYKKGDSFSFRLIN